MPRARRFFQMPLYEKINQLRDAYFLAKTHFFYRYVFGSMGSHCLIRKPVSLYNTRYIHLGNRVLIRNGVRLNAIVDKPSRVPDLRIGDNVTIEQNVHIICHSRVRIGNNVSIAGHCAIVDTTHPYEDVGDPRPIGARILDEDSYVEIGDNCFLGFGAIVMPNVCIGKHSVVGANSCVTNDVPDFSVVAGSPAVVIRMYDPAKEIWVRQAKASVE
ncbi:MAG TPA: acyltransferase [Silvibacterium sp.]|nr:acyltransferase [Silvibacterium sp.]